MSWNTCHSINYQEPNVGNASGGGGLTSVGLSGAEFAFTSNPLIANGLIGVSLTANGVAFTKIAQVTANKLVGNPTGSTANMSEITLGTNLLFSAGALSLSANVTVQGNTFNAANQLLQLDGAALIPIANLPALAITDTFVVASQAAMLALTAQTGDIAVRSDISKSYILKGANPAVLADWTELLSPTAYVTSVNASGGATGFSFSGGPITASGTLTMSGILTVANGGTGVGTSTGSGSVVLSTSPTLVTPVFNGLPTGTGVASAATVSTLATRDASGILRAVSFVPNYTSTATAAGTTTLTVASTEIQRFSGSTTQNVVMPVTSTLVTGQYYWVQNSSSGSVTVQSSGANTIIALTANQSARVTCIGTALTTAADWNYEVYQQSYAGGGYSAPTLGSTSIGSGATVTTIAGLTLTSTTFTASTNVIGGVTMTLGSDVNGDMYFRQGGVLTRMQLGAAGSFVKSLGGIPASTAPYTYTTKSAAYTLVLADASSIIELTGASAFSFTIPLNATIAYEIGTVITFVQTGTGALTIAATGGVTINSEFGLILNAQYSVATIMKIATNTWVMGGSLRVS